MFVGSDSTHNKSSCTSSSKLYRTKTSRIALLSTSVDSSTWIAYHSEPFTLSNNCASISSAIASICLWTVLAERGTEPIFFVAASPRSSLHKSFAAGRISSYPIVKGFLHLARRLATKYEAFSAATFTDVVVLSTIFCDSCTRFLCSKKPRGFCSVGCLDSKCRISFDGFIASFDNVSPHTTHNGLGACDSPVSINPYFRYDSSYFRLKDP